MALTTSVQYLITNVDKYVDEQTVLDSEGNPLLNTWQMYSCAFDNGEIKHWNGDVPLNEPLLTPTSEIIQRLIDVYGSALSGKTIAVDLENVDGNIVRLI
jgi:hypothetical protein